MLLSFMALCACPEEEAQEAGVGSRENPGFIILVHEDCSAYPVKLLPSQGYPVQGLGGSFCRSPAPQHQAPLPTLNRFLSFNPGRLQSTQHPHWGLNPNSAVSLSRPQLDMETMLLSWIPSLDGTHPLCEKVRAACCVNTSASME
jgi:hypothetical protein